MMVDFLARPKVILELKGRVEELFWRRYLRDNRCIVRVWRGTVHPEDMTGSDIIITNGPSERWWSGLPSQPKIILIAQTEADSARISGVESGLLREPVDPRQLLAMVHAAVLDIPNATCEVLRIDDDLSIVPEVGLVFWNSKLVKLHVIERRVLCAIARAPGKLFRWESLLPEGDGRRGYNHVAKIRKALQMAGADHEYLQTYSSRGIAFIARKRMAVTAE